MTNNKILHGLQLSRRAVLAAAAVSATALFTFAAPAPSFAEDKSIKVGIMAGEEEDIWRVVTSEAAKKGLKIETVVFNDYTQPNEALEQGEIDANAFQHQPYLDNQIQQHGYHIVRAGYTGVWPIGSTARNTSPSPKSRKGPSSASRTIPRMKAGRCAFFRAKA
jgi:D-methionine transport system substrate-binding protein